MVKNFGLFALFLKLSHMTSNAVSRLTENRKLVAKSGAHLNAVGMSR